MTSRTEQSLSEALHDIVAAQPFVPDPTAIERRGLLLRRRAMATRGAVGAGVVAVAAVVAVTTVGTIRPDPTANRQTAGTAHHTTGRVGASGPLVRLADYLHAIPVKQTGDATLSIRSTIYPDNPPDIVADLYADNGKYFFAPTRSGLPAQVAANNDQGYGIYAREVAAASYAANGDLAVARQRMADASASGPDMWPAGAIKPKGPFPANVADSGIWANAVNGLIAGDGDPRVRAGFLRIASTLPEITVKNTTTDGQPTLSLKAGREMFANAPATTRDIEETLTINAHTGVPLRVTVGAPGGAPDATISYQFSRVTLSDVAAGKF
jgi:hypothetical protein